MASPPYTSRASGVFWITSLHADEVGLSNRVAEDLETFLVSQSYGFDKRVPANAGDFLDMLNQLSIHGANGGRRILHLDMHGSQSDGLQIAATGEFIPWVRVMDALRRVNIAVKNNLVVVSTACSSAHILSALGSLTGWQKAPFFALVAPPKDIEASIVADHVLQFYQDVINNGDLSKAHRDNLGKELAFFSCERMLFDILVSYAATQCIGKAGKARRERLVTALRKQQPNIKEEDLKIYRQGITEAMDLDHPFTRKQVRQFLFDREIPFPMSRVMEKAKERLSEQHRLKVKEDQKIKAMRRGRKG